MRSSNFNQMLSLHFISFLLLLFKAQLSHASSLFRTSHLPSPPTTSYVSSERQSTLTVAPTLSCFLYNQDPDQGILSQFCVCNDTISLPMTPPPSPRLEQPTSESCSYTTSPVSNLIHLAWYVVDIGSKRCQTCTSVGFPQYKCWTNSNCDPQATSVVSLPYVPAVFYFRVKKETLKFELLAPLARQGIRIEIGPPLSRPLL